MNVNTTLSLDLLLFARSFDPSIAPRQVGVLLGQQNATTMPRTTPRQIIEMVEHLVPRVDVMEVLDGFAEGVGPKSTGLPQLHVFTGCTWIVVASRGFFDTASIRMLCRLEMREGGPDRYLAVTDDDRPPRYWGTTTVQEWQPEQGWSWADPAWKTEQAALIATIKDGKFKAPSVHAFLYRQAGQ